MNNQTQQIESLFSVKDKSVIITGATGALGQAVASGFAQASAKVMLTARRQPELLAIAEELAEAGGNVSFCAADPSSEEDVKQLVARTVEIFGEVNVLCACHGFNKPKSVLEQSVAEWQAIMNANATSMYILSKITAEEMVKQNKGGKIILTSSARSQRGMKGYTGYSTAKAGVDLMAQALACDLGEYNIQVNTFNPTVFRSELTEWMFHDEGVYKNFLKRLPIGRLGEPSDFVGPALFLASSASDFMTASNIPVDGGYWGN